ncbi:hypothetical protein TrRE_jg11212, partial [Triparma retinervis]
SSAHEGEGHIRGCARGSVLTEDKARYATENTIFVLRIVEDIGGVGEAKIVTKEFHAKVCTLYSSPSSLPPP